MSRQAKFTLLACLYFSQGLPYGFFDQALPVMMREQGASLTLIGFATLLKLPWALKFLWAPFIDRVGFHRIGRKRGWLLLLQLLAAVLFLALATNGGSAGFQVLVWGFLLANLIAATQDIATDGLAVHLLTPAERGLGNGLQVAGYRLGMIAGGGAILIAFAQLGWAGSFATMAGLILLTSLPLLKLKEPAAAPPEFQQGYWQALTGSFMSKGFASWLFLIAFYKFGDQMTSTMARPFLKDMGLTLADIGKLLGVAGSVSGLAGSLAGGYLVYRWGRGRALISLGLIQAVAVFGYALLVWRWLPESWLYAICGVEYFTGGMANAALFTVMMDVCKKETAATDYTVQASAVVLATSGAAALSGLTAYLTSYGTTFVISGCLSAVGALLFIPRLRGRANDRNPVTLVPRPPKIL